MESEHLPNPDVNELTEALLDAHREVLDLRTKLDEYKWLDDAIRNRTHELSERIKELECLYSVSDSFSERNKNLDEILSHTVSIIPGGFQNPDRTWISLKIFDRSFLSPGFRQTEHMISSDIFIHGKKAGCLTVFTSASFRVKQEIPFLKEEHSMLKALSFWIGQIVDNYNREKSRSV